MCGELLLCVGSYCCVCGELLLCVWGATAVCVGSYCCVCGELLLADEQWSSASNLGTLHTSQAGTRDHATSLMSHKALCCHYQVPPT